MFCMPSAIEDILMEVPLNIPQMASSMALAYNVIPIMISLKAPALECIFKGTWSLDIQNHFLYHQNNKLRHQLMKFIELG